MASQAADQITLNIRNFDPRSIPPTAVMLIVGKRGTGKSTLLCDLMYHNRHKFDCGLVFSATEEANGYWGQYIPPAFVYNDFDEKALSRFVAAMKQTNQGRTKEAGNLRYGFVIFDDTAASKMLRTNRDIRTILFNGRHFGIFTAIVLQYALDIPPELRSQVDYVCLLRNNVVLDRERLYRHYCGFFPTLNSFCITMNRCTEGYGCLIVNNLCRSNSVADAVYWYEAKTHKPYDLGSKAMWKYAKVMKSQASSSSSSVEHANSRSKVVSTSSTARDEFADVCDEYGRCTQRSARVHVRRVGGGN
jgi:hypothetical protein